MPLPAGIVYHAHQVAMALVDIVYRWLPQPLPSDDALRSCKIVAHRGHHNGTDLLENTMAAFEAAADCGVWGIECDVRWTSDGVPVVIHDPNARRVFGVDCEIACTAAADLRARAPGIPLLTEVVAGLGGKVHLMIELKEDPTDGGGERASSLANALAPLKSGRDYHLIALDPTFFEQLTIIDHRHCLPVAETNPGAMSAYALSWRLGGLTGHYLLLTRAMQRYHEAAGQKIGTGFVASKYCLFRELNRGIEWIFSNDAVELQAVRDRYLRSRDR